MRQLNYTLLIIRCRGCLEYKKRTCAGASSFAESCRSANSGRC